MRGGPSFKFQLLFRAGLGWTWARRGLYYDRYGSYEG